MLINECNDVIIENITVNTNETSNVTKPAMPPIIEEVAQLLCPNDCTFNGKCVNGSCVCNKDYTANDCSISIYQKPSIARYECKKNVIYNALYMVLKESNPDVRTPGKTKLISFPKDQTLNALLYI